MCPTTRRVNSSIAGGTHPRDAVRSPADTTPTAALRKPHPQAGTRIHVNLVRMCSLSPIAGLPIAGLAPLRRLGRQTAEGGIGPRPSPPPARPWRTRRQPAEIPMEFRTGVRTGGEQPARETTPGRVTKARKAYEELRAVSERRAGTTPARWAPRPGRPPLDARMPSKPAYAGRHEHHRPLVERRSPSTPRCVPRAP